MQWTGGCNDFSSRGFELQLGETHAEVAGICQRRVRVFLNNPAPIEPQNAIAGKHCRQPMRDYDGSVLLHQLRQRRRRHVSLSASSDEIASSSNTS
jgi:hypothetical protein